MRSFQRYTGIVAGAVALLAGLQTTAARAQQGPPSKEEAPLSAKEAAASLKAITASQKIPIDPVNFTGTWFPYQPEGFAMQPPPELTPAADKALKAWRALGAKGITPPTASGHCIPPGVPSLLIRIYPIQIVRTPKDLITIHEYESQLRFIRMNAKHPAPEDIIPTFNGDSVGHWEGKTLVIDSVGFKTEVGGLPTQPQAGISISPDFHLVERWTLSPDGRMITDEMTMTDKEVFAKPWKTMKRFKRRDDLQLMEYTCLVEENLIEIDASGKETFKKGSD